MKSKHASDTSELWIISVPNEGSAEHTWQQLNSATQHSGTFYSQNYRVNLPELKVGTLDELVSLADDLQKTDATAERICRKIVTYFETVLDREKDSLSENLVVESNCEIKIGFFKFRIRLDDAFTYATKFKWDLARFPVRLPLSSLNGMIIKRSGQIESELKSRSLAFDAINQKIQAELKSHKGNLLTKDISTIVKASDFVLGSETMKTSIVCVPKSLYNTWINSYETLSSMVVPRSSRLLAEDEEYGLFAVIIFRKVEDSFIYACRQKGFYAKSFEYNEEGIVDKAARFKELEAERTHMFGPLIRWLKINFSESFVDWMHAKVLRAYVESVLRFGLPVNFQVFILHPNVKASKLGDILDKMYSTISHGPLSFSKKKIHEDEYYDTGEFDASGGHPFVMFTMNLTFTG